MDESHKKEFGIVISALFESYGQEATSPRLLGYWMGLGDLVLDDVKKAVTKAIRASERLPTPVELRRFAGELAPEDRAQAAWGDVLRAIPCGPYKHVDFEDSVINAAIRMLGGWPTFVSRFSGAESEKWARLEFLKTYQSLADYGVTGEAAAALPGLAEVQCFGGKVIPYQPIPVSCDQQRKLLAVKAKEQEGPLLEFQRP